MPLQLKSILCLFLFKATSMLLSPANLCAQQQQWATQYIYWHFDREVKEVYNVDQEIWLPSPNNHTFWPFSWNWEGSDQGGYLGLQQSMNAANVRFSIWNATEAVGQDCIPFGGEGEGYTCTLPVVLDTQKLYRCRLWRLNDTNGNWWSGWLIEEDAQGQLQEHFIGKIKAPENEKHSVEASSIMNFVEYWGDHISPCEKVPLSIAVFSPPSINYEGGCTGNYESHSTYALTKAPMGNLCKTGSEEDGALCTTQKLSLNGIQAITAFMGGRRSEHLLSFRPHPPPDTLPTCAE